MDPVSLAAPFIRDGLMGTALVAVIIAVVLLARRDGKRSDRIEASREAERKITQEQLVPALVRANDATGRIGELVEKNIDQLAQNNELMRELRDLLRELRMR